MAPSLRPSHRNPNELQREVCDLCGSEVGHLHLLEADVEGLRGFKVCDLHGFERLARVTPSLNDLQAMNPRVPSPDVARREPIGAAPWFASSTEYYLSLDGVNDKGTATLACPAGGMTIEAKATVDTTSSAARWIAGWRMSGSDVARRGLNLRLTGSNLLGFVIGNDAGTVYSAEMAGVLADTSYEIAGVLDPAMSRMRLYVDRTLVAETAVAGSFTSVRSSFAIGTEPELNTSWFPGSISRVRLWSVPLTTAQVDAFSGIDLLGDEPGLLSCWELRDGLAASVNSVVGGPSMTISGATWTEVV